MFEETPKTGAPSDEDVDKLFNKLASDISTIQSSFENHAILDEETLKKNEENIKKIQDSSKSLIESNKKTKSILQRIFPHRFKNYEKLEKQINAYDKAKFKKEAEEKLVEISKIKSELKNVIDSENSLQKACFDGDLTLVENIIRDETKFIRLNQSKKGESPLHIATALGHKKIVEALIKQGVDLNVDAKKNEKGQTAFHIACSNGQASIAALLLSKGANLNSRDINNKTPTHLAYESGHNALAKFLVYSNADVNAKDDKGQTLLHKAASKHDAEFAGILLAHKASLNIKDHEMKIPLDCAIAKSQVFEELKTQSASSIHRLKDSQGRNMMLLAYDNKSIGLLETLIQLGDKKMLFDQDKDGNTLLHRLYYDKITLLTDDKTSFKLNLIENLIGTKLTEAEYTKLTSIQNHIGGTPKDLKRLHEITERTEMNHPHPQVLVPYMLPSTIIGNPIESIQELYDEGFRFGAGLFDDNLMFMRTALSKIEDPSPEQLQELFKYIGIAPNIEYLKKQGIDISKILLYSDKDDLAKIPFSDIKKPFQEVNWEEHIKKITLREHPIDSSEILSKNLQQWTAQKESRQEWMKILQNAKSIETNDILSEEMSETTLSSITLGQLRNLSSESFKKLLHLNQKRKQSLDIPLDFIQNKQFQSFNKDDLNLFYTSELISLVKRIPTWEQLVGISNSLFTLSDEQLKTLIFDHIIKD